MLAVEVIAKTKETDDIALFRLARTDQSPLPAFTAGSHVDVHLGNGIVRQYSLCSAPHINDYYDIAIYKEPASRGGSLYLHNDIDVGSCLQISEPRNLFPLADNVKHHLLLAGGIGITPLLSMAEYLSKKDESFTLHYCAKTAQKAAFYQLIQQSDFAKQTNFHFSKGRGAGGVDSAGDRSGRIDISDVLKQQNEDTHLYVCGPSGFMDAVLDAARSAGWTEDRLHYEFFVAKTTDSDEGGDQPFEVEISSTGEVIDIPVGQTALNVLLDKGIDVPFACEEGVCGSCATRLLSGEPDHRDVFMTPEEHAGNQEFAPCCSRAKGGRLVLDL